MNRRIVVAIDPSRGGLRRIPDEGIEMGHGVRICRVAELKLTKDDYSHLSEGDRREFEDCRAAIVTEYKGIARREQDPESPGQTREGTALNKIRLAAFALYLTKPNPLSFHVVLHQERTSSGWVLAGADTHWRSVVPLPSYERAVLDLSDIAKGKALFETLSSHPQNTPVFRACRLLIKALGDPEWLIRYPLLWFGLEALFGVDDAREVSFRIAQRIALFLVGGGPRAVELSRQVKADYGLRSKTVHGVLPRGGQPGQLTDAAERTESLLRDALLKILQSASLRASFAPKSRDSFLDALGFQRDPA